MPCSYFLLKLYTRGWSPLIAQSPRLLQQLLSGILLVTLPREKSLEECG